MSRVVAGVGVVLAGVVMASCGGSSSAGADGGVGDGARPTGENRSCMTLPVLCDVISANDVATIFTGPATLTVMPNDHVLPGEICGWDRAHPPLHVTATYNCYNETLSTAHVTFQQLRTIAMTEDHFEDLSGIGDEAYWSYTKTSTIAFVDGSLYARVGNVIVAVSGYTQYNEDASGAQQAIDPAVAKVRALGMIQKVMNVTGL
jgi:hypothetical protein